MTTSSLTIRIQNLVILARVKMTELNIFGSIRAKIGL